MYNTTYFGYLRVAFIILNFLVDMYVQFILSVFIVVVFGFRHFHSKQKQTKR